MRMGSEVSAWLKVFLWNGLIWPPYILGLAFLVGVFPPSEGSAAWPLGFSHEVNMAIAFSLTGLAFVVTTGGGMCVFRRMVRWIASEAARTGKKLPAMRWRWFWSYFLEVDEDYRLRP